MIRLRLLALNEYGIGVIDILSGSVRHIGWHIVRRQAICREVVLVLNLYKIGTARTSQLFASPTYHIRGWMIYLVEAR